MYCIITSKLYPSKVWLIDYIRDNLFNSYFFASQSNTVNNLFNSYFFASQSNTVECHNSTQCTIISQTQSDVYCKYTKLVRDTLILYLYFIIGPVYNNIPHRNAHKTQHLLTWACIFSYMWLQSPVVDSLWFLVTVPVLHLSGKEAQLLPTMSHGYDNTTDMVPFWAVMTAHCVRRVHCKTCNMTFRFQVILFGQSCGGV